MSCEHEYRYLGVRYCDGWHNRPGSGAVTRYYAHVFFCMKCTDSQGKPIEDQHTAFSSYEIPRFNALPGNADECGVPKHDRSSYYR